MVRARSAGITLTERLKNRLADFSEALERVEEAFTAIGALVGNDEIPLVEVDGVDSRRCEEWRKTLSRIGDELSFWGRTFRRRHKTTPTLLSAEDADDEGDSEGALEVEIEDAYGSSYEGWDVNKEGASDKGELPNSARFYEPPRWAYTATISTRLPSARKSSGLRV